MNKYLALVCILREENFDKQGLIDYNFQCFKQAIEEIFSTKNDEIAVHLAQTNGENGEQFSIKGSSMKDDEKLFNNNHSITNWTSSTVKFVSDSLFCIFWLPTLAFGKIRIKN